ncbi:MAG: DUF1254 domain-containing protein [Chromatiaceae bacterium]|nr:DUF1254 domain-containing protein [Chromatiaceae bacterium]MBP8282632.1 DUF1254 domain-containing protein [Chromatiaceae bacterium]MBP8288619.1 DUF1254 domain-containing protein [Chromatiaceae bacterium]MBP9603201.1 DUF1254 domain-containing protein [Chromatiaceae bacterium]
MTSIKRSAAALCLGALVALPLAAGAAATGGPGAVEAIKIATDAYIYGYPLVTFDMARRQQTNVAAPDAEHAPMGQMIRMRTYPAVDNHCCAAPNADTLYTEAWLDVSAEPAILSIPAMGDRYYIAPLLDGWSEVIEAAGTYTTGGKAQTYAITGPGWSGTLPEGVTQVKPPTGMVWLLGRVYSTGTPEDYKAVHALQDQFSVVPLSAYGTPYTPPAGAVDPGFDMKTSVRKLVNGLNVDAYFERLAELMKTNPPTAEDAPMVAQMARIGLVPGQPFDPSKLDFLDCELLKTVPKLALLEMGLHLKRQKTTNGWLYFTKGVGDFGTDYLTRGIANLLGPGWNRPQDAVYPLSLKDAHGDDYDGAKHNYVMHFDKGQRPPAEAFWSVTLYDSDFFFVPNPIDRYDLAQRDKLNTNPDGSVDLYIQADSPGKDREANWLPAPKGKFQLVMRIYAPKKTPPSILDGTWTPPPVMKVQ